MKEINIKFEDIPKKLYHVIPIEIFKKYTDAQGNYDSRNKADFGGNTPYIHTAPSIEQMNKHLDYLKNLNDPVFYLLEINIDKLKPKKVTYFDIEGRIYHHLWCPLKKNSYKKILVCKNEKGEIIEK